MRKERIDIQRKVSLKFKEFQGFITEFSENISTGGMFIRTITPQPVGSIFDFEFTLGEDYTLIHGLGEVVWMREQDEGFDRPAGMGVRFLSLDPESRELIDRIVDERLARQQTAGVKSPPPDEWGMGEDETPSAAGTSTEGSLDVAPSPGAADSSREPSWKPSWAPPPAEETAEAEESEPAERDEPTLSELAGLNPAEERVPRSTGPSPYARSYRATTSESGRFSGRGARAVLLVVLVAAFLAAVAAGFFWLFPDVAVGLLSGGEEDREADVGSEALSRGAAEPDRRQESGVGDETPGAGVARPRPDAEGRAGAPAEGATGVGETREPAAEVPETASEPAPDAAPQSGAEPVRDEEPGAEQGRSRRPQTATGTAVEEPLPPAPAGDPFTQVRNITWQELDDQLLITIHLDGAVQEWDYSLARIGTPPPRQLVRIQGVREPFPRTAIPVAAEMVERVRTGFHPRGDEPELHVVLDLVDEEVVLERSEVGDKEIRLYLSREARALRPGSAER